MELLKNLVLPPWLNLRFIAIWLIGLAFLGLLWSWNERGHQVQRLADFQSGVISAVSDATVPPDKNGRVALLKPDQVVAAISGLKSSYASAKGTIKYINGENVKYKNRADAADKRLSTELAQFNSQYAVANKRIQFLLSRPPVGPEKMCRTIEDDTNSAWDGWK